MNFVGYSAVFPIVLVDHDWQPVRLVRFVLAVPFDEHTSCALCESPCWWT